MKYFGSTKKGKKNKQFCRFVVLPFLCFDSIDFSNLEFWNTSNNSAMFSDHPPFHSLSPRWAGPPPVPPQMPSPARTLVWVKSLWLLEISPLWGVGGALCNTALAEKSCRCQLHCTLPLDRLCKRAIYDCCSVMSSEKSLSLCDIIHLVVRTLFVCSFIFDEKLAILHTYWYSRVLLHPLTHLGRVFNLFA